MCEAGRRVLPGSEKDERGDLCEDPKNNKTILVTVDHECCVVT